MIELGFNKTCFTPINEIKLSGQPEQKNIDISSYIIFFAEKAFNNRAYCKVGINKGRISNISFNRRYFMKDGKVELFPFKDDPNIFKPEGRRIWKYV